MQLQQIAEELNILSYPDALNNVINHEDQQNIADINWLSDLESEYNVLGEYFPLVCEAATELQNSEALLSWGMIVSNYLSSCTVPEACQIPMPKRDGTIARDFLPLLILLTQLPTGVTEYRHREMPEDMIRRNLFHFVDGISIVKRKTDRPAIDQTYFNWLVKFVKAKIFNAHGFNFELRTLPDNVCVLQNKHAKTIHPVLIDTNMHRTGRVLSTAGYTDEEYSFKTVFSETADEFLAHPCINGLVSSAPASFPKADYHIAVRPGDSVLSVHIPRGTDISAQNASISLSAGFKDAQVFYPELDIKALYCSSWLLDPALKVLLKPGSNIPQFGNIFTRFPAKSAGKEVFSFVFPRVMPLEGLPETTSLERALKKHYLNGNFIHAYAGIVLPEAL